MAKEYDNTNRGVLFTNTRKIKDSQPDYNGKIDIAGTEYWLSAWVKQGKNGDFLSLSLGDEIEDKPASAQTMGAVANTVIPTTATSGPVKPVETTLIDESDDISF